MELEANTIGKIKAALGLKAWGVSSPEAILDQVRVIIDQHDAAAKAEMNELWQRCIQAGDDFNAAVKGASREW